MITGFGNALNYLSHQVLFVDEEQDSGHLIKGLRANRVGSESLRVFDFLVQCLVEECLYAVD